MKRKLLRGVTLLLSSLFFGLIVSEKTSAQWVTRYTIRNLATNPMFDQVSAVNDSVVWIYRDNTIIKTLDGGSTWKQKPITGLQTDFSITTLCALDKKTALIAGFSYNTTNFGIVYRTEDGGKTWTEVLKRAGISFDFTIAMRDAKNGIMTVDASTVPFTVLKTADGGKTWSTNGITTPKTGGGIVFGYQSLNVLGNDIWFGTNTFKVFHSADFGLTWSVLNKMPGFPGVINSVNFQSQLDGVVSLTNSDGVNITHDGGITWIHTGQPAGPFFSYTQTALLVGNEGWFIPNPSDDYQIFHSVDNGNTWTSQFKDSVPFFQTFYDLVRSPHSLWVLGQQKIYSYALNVPGKKASAINTDNLSNTATNFSCYPNPAAGLTHIQFSTVTKSQVSVVLLNEAGSRVALIEDKFLEVGVHHYQFNFSSLPAGIYYCSLRIGNNYSKTKIVHTKN